MRWLLCIVLLSSGCDLLFPEFSGNGSDAAIPGDGGVDDGGGPPLVAGVVCVLGDVRDYRTCTTAAQGVLRISVEETRDQTTTDAAGHFTLKLSQKLDIATIGVVDPANNFAPTVVPLRLTAGVASGVALPVVTQATLQTLELDNGLQADPGLGIFLGWAVDATGAPVAGVSSGNHAALYDDNAPNALSPGTATHNDGTVAFFNVPPTTLSLTLTPPPTVPVSGDVFTLPIRPGAVTASTLVLPPR
ncbi:MAG TPA: hypothetical protein VN947_23260 [Polyangia bacterium]|nr:hypothetical protein [Polyangia bacterium]